MRRAHAMPFGACVAGEGARFRLWAPSADAVTLCLEGPGAAQRGAMERAPGGWFELSLADVRPGTRYRFDVGVLVPDPASRFQPEGVHGPSQLVDPRAFSWSDGSWRGRPWQEAVLYELHVGAFGESGDYRGVERHLDHLAELGVTALELMPVAECAGRRNWGYDGVLPYAPRHGYGSPDALKRLVAACHARELMVLLDVVYNHFGPEGNHLAEYARDFFDASRETPWGPALDFDGSPEVRSFFVHNALYWLEEFHLDGLRLDAVHAIPEEGRAPFLEALRGEAERRFRDRHVHLVLENDRNEAAWLERDAEGRPRLYTAQWNDDLHHALHVALTGERDGYYGDYAGEPLRHLGRALAEGFAWQGEASPFRGGATRGEPSAQLPPAAFVAFLQNHDQVGNRALGERAEALAQAPALRAALALLLLAPQIPLLFMGEEWGAPEPFLFFCDFEPGLARAVREGRRREFARFAAFADPAARERIPDPGSAAAFEASRLDWSRVGREPHASRLREVRELLALRHREIVPRLARARRGGSFELPEAGTLRVRWPLGGSEALHLRARLASTPGRAPADPLPGALLHGTHPHEGEAAAAWSVRWHLEAGTGA